MPLRKKPPNTRSDNGPASIGAQVYIWSAGLWCWVVAVRDPTDGHLRERTVLGSRQRADRIADRRQRRAWRRYEARRGGASLAPFQGRQHA